MHSKLGKFCSEENPTFFYVTGWKNPKSNSLLGFVNGSVVKCYNGNFIHSWHKRLKYFVIDVQELTDQFMVHKFILPKKWILIFYEGGEMDIDFYEERSQIDNSLSGDFVDSHCSEESDDSLSEISSEESVEDRIHVDIMLESI